MKHGPRPSAIHPVRPSEPAGGDAPTLDEAHLARLLRAVGAARSAQLIDQIRADLDQIATGVLSALSAGRWPELRRLGHNLVAIAGTAGAGQLATRATVFHAECRDENTGEAARLLPGLLALVADLQDRLAMHRATLVSRATAP